MEFLFVEEQPMAGREASSAPGTTVGREGCDHVLADPEVSRTHATFREVDAQLGVEDAGSTNGTFVNDVRASGIQVLVPGDQSAVRQHRLALRDAPPGARSPLPPRSTRPVPSAPARAPTRACPTACPPGCGRRSLPRPCEGAAPVFDAARPPRRILGASAARRMEATLACYVVIVATACGVVAFFVQR